MGKSKKEPALSVVTDNRERVVNELQNLGSKECNLVVLVSGLTAPPNSLEHTLVALEKLAAESNKSYNCRTLIYRSVVNFEERSKDGVMVCGRRLAAEINELVQLISNDTVKTLNLSLSGTSFGGLIARAALADVQWKMPNGVTIVPKIFSTVMTPHLGSKDSMHWDKVPKPFLFFLRRFMAVTMKQTGKDLMRYKSDAIDRLLDEPQYMEPLARFEKREAYTNSYRTDFRVATGSAVFISPDSESRHQTVSDMTEDFPFAVHALTTPKKIELEEQPLSTANSNHPKCNNPWMKESCEKLDSLGWTKVFCDMRSDLPSYKVPSLRRKKKTIDLTTETSSTSAQLWNQYCHGHPETRGTWFLPQAHSALMATADSVAPPPEDHYLCAGLPFVKEYSARIMKEVLR